MFSYTTAQTIDYTWIQRPVLELRYKFENAASSFFLPPPNFIPAIPKYLLTETSFAENIGQSSAANTAFGGNVICFVSSRVSPNVIYYKPNSNPLFSKLHVLSNKQQLSVCLERSKNAGVKSGLKILLLNNIIILPEPCTISHMYYTHYIKIVNQLNFVLCP